MRLAGSLTMRNIGAGLLTGFGVATFACFIVLTLWWFGNSSSQPNSHLGLIYRDNSKGVIHYVSAFQSTSLCLLAPASVILFVIGYAMAPKTNIRTAKTWLGRSMRFDLDDPKNVVPKSQLVGAAMAPIILFTVGQLFVRLLNSWGVVLNFG